jgi:DNA-binding NtrC family response regulator
MPGRPTVVVIDDEVLLATALIDIVKGLGAEVVGVAHAYADALQLLEASVRCEIAFIDLKLGDTLSGVQLAQRAVELGIKVIAMTGFPRLPTGLEGAALLTKPFSIEAVRLVFDMLRPRGRT